MRGKDPTDQLLYNSEIERMTRKNFKQTKHKNAQCESSILIYSDLSTTNNVANHGDPPPPQMNIIQSKTTSPCSHGRI